MSPRHRSMSDATQLVPKLEKVRARSGMILEESESKELEQEGSSLVGKISHVFEVEKEREAGKPTVVQNRADDSILRHDKKRLFVCCDGTWKNASGTVAPLTNVAILARCVDRIGRDHEPSDQPSSHTGGLKNQDERVGLVRQLVYYSSGVGTQSSLSMDSGIAGATGYGVTANILNAYCFICNNYNFCSLKDELILVGFSRGAFTVRCLAAFINEVGLLRRKGLPFLRLLFNHWRRKETDQLKRISKALDPLRNKKNIRVKVLAEWDPVSAMGLPFGFCKPEFSFVNQKVPQVVDNAFVALALNEKRPSFEALPWTKCDQNTTVKQCAFVGSHSDIGGGNLDPGLSTVSLLWMISQISTACGAQFDSTSLLQFLTPLQSSLLGNGQAVGAEKNQELYVQNLAATKGHVHESLTGWWLIPEYLSLGFWRGERYTMLDRLAQAESQQQQRHQHHRDEKILDTCGVTVHFTARLVKDRIQCGLFERYKLDKKTTPFRWLRQELGTSSETRRVTSFLVEESITDIEKELLRKWLDIAVYWWVYGPNTDDSAPDGDEINWSLMVQDLGLHYEPGCDRDESLVDLIQEELKNQNALGPLANLF